MLFDAAIVSLLAGTIWLLAFRLVKGRFPTSLGKVEIRRAELFVLAFGLQLGLVLLGMKGIGWAIKIFPWVHILSYLLLIGAVFLNRRLPAMWMVAAGVLLNFAVITANFGRMPADVKRVRQTGGEKVAALVGSAHYPRWTPINPQTRLAFLGDVLVLPRPYPRPCVFSLGDIFITAGACWLILAAFGMLPAQFSREAVDATP